jgi:hypothetical protein
LGGCQKITLKQQKIDDGIIISQTAVVRNSTAVLAVDLTELKRGAEVEILQREGKDWVKVRAGNSEGWIEARHIISRSLIDQIRALEQEVKMIPPQAIGQLTGHAALRVTPGRASEGNIAFYVPSNTVVEILSRVRTVRMSDEVLPKVYQPLTPRRRTPSNPNQEQPVQYDYWYQVKLPEPFLVRVGWLYAPLVELKVPERLLHLQGEYGFVAWYELAKVEDPEIGTSSHYLTFDRHRTSPIAGTDFDRIRLWIWDTESHRYKIGRWEIAHGILPVFHQFDAKVHHFRMKLYNPKSGQLEDASYTVDLTDPLNPRLTRVKR